MQMYGSTNIQDVMGAPNGRPVGVADGQGMRRRRAQNPALRNAAFSKYATQLGLGSGVAGTGPGNPAAWQTGIMTSAPTQAKTPQTMVQPAPGNQTTPVSKLAIQPAQTQVPKAAPIQPLPGLSSVSGIPGYLQQLQAQQAQQAQQKALYAAGPQPMSVPAPRAQAPGGGSFVDSIMNKYGMRQ